MYTAFTLFLYVLYYKTNFFIYNFFGHGLRYGFVYLLYTLMKTAFSMFPRINFSGIIKIYYENRLFNFLIFY